MNRTLNAPLIASMGLLAAAVDLDSASMWIAWGIHALGVVWKEGQR